MLLQCPDYAYRVEDNTHITPAILQERRAAREKYIEKLLVRMGLDVGVRTGREA